MTARADFRRLCLPMPPTSDRPLRAVRGPEADLPLGRGIAHVDRDVDRRAFTDLDCGPDHPGHHRRVYRRHGIVRGKERIMGRCDVIRPRRLPRWTCQALWRLPPGGRRSGPRPTRPASGPPRAPDPCPPCGLTSGALRLLRSRSRHGRMVGQRPGSRPCGSRSLARTWYAGPAAGTDGRCRPRGFAASRRTPLGRGFLPDQCPRAPPVRPPQAIRGLIEPDGPGGRRSGRALAPQRQIRFPRASARTLRI